MIRVQPEQSESITFDALGRTLDLLDGDQVNCGLAFKSSWPAPDSETALLGGCTGTLKVITDADLAVRPRIEAPEGSTREGEREYVIEAGDLVLAIGSSELVGAAYQNGVLRMQMGPLLVSLSTEQNGGPSDA